MGRIIGRNNDSKIHRRMFEGYFCSPDYCKKTLFQAGNRVYHIVGTRGFEPPAP